MRVLVISIVFLISLRLLAAENTHICYFSLNNDKEFTAMEQFTNKLNKYSPRKITVSEHQTIKSNPEESFKKMIESGVKCDGLVISGHHTGSFGGKRGRGSLGVGFMEKLSCDPKYSKWFENIQALWLQGCRTLGVKIEADSQTSADFHTARVGAVREEDALTQSLAELNIEFSATLDQDNPLSSRYLRLFPQATVFGWTKTAPGEKARSELSIPYHIAHISNLNRDRSKFFTAPDKELDQASAAKYASTMLGVLNRKQLSQQSPCFVDQKSAVKGWLNHGGVAGRLPFSFSNPDLQGFESFDSNSNSLLKQARELDCLLKNSNDHKAKIQLIDAALKDERLLGYTFSSIWQYMQNLKREGKFAELNEVQQKLKTSPVLKDFLMKKLAAKELGLIRKIDYYTFYREMTGERYQNIEDRLGEAFVAVMNKPISSYDDLDFQRTLLSTMDKNGLISEKTKMLMSESIKKGLISRDPQLRYSALQRIRSVRITDPAIHQLLATMLDQSTNESEKINLLRALKDLKSSDPVVHASLIKVLNNSDRYTKEYVLEALSECTSEDLAVHKVIASNLSDTDSRIRMTALRALSRIKKPDVTIQRAIAKTLTDQSWGVKIQAADALVNIVPTDHETLTFMSNALKDRDDNVRASLLKSFAKVKTQDVAIQRSIVELLGGDNYYLRGLAGDALLGIAPTDTKVLDEIKSKDKDLYKRLTKKDKKFFGLF